MIKTKKSKLHALVASATAICVVFTQVAVAAPAFSASAPEVSLPNTLRLDQAMQISVPSAVATIDKFIPGSGKTIFHIQTAHGQYQAEKNIEQLLAHLEKNYGVQTLLSEGASQPLNPEIINFFPEDRKSTLEVVDAFVRHAVITGPEVFLLNSGKAIGFGIEDEATYEQNLQDFVSVIQAREASTQFLSDLNLGIERLSAIYLSSEARSFLKQVERKETGDVPFDIYLQQLKVAAEKHAGIKLDDPSWQLLWPMLVRVFTLEKLEKKIDAAQFDKQKKDFLMAIRPYTGHGPRATNHDRQTRGSGDVERGTIFDEVKNLLELKDLSAKLPDPETSIVFENLVKVLPSNFNYARFSSVTAFCGILMLKSEIKADDLAQEIERLEDYIAGKLADNKNAKEIVAILKDYRMLQKLFALELLPADYDSIVTTDHRLPTTDKKIQPSQITERLKSLADRSSRQSSVISLQSAEGLDALYAQAIRFYEGARKRDTKMLARIEERLAETGADKVAIVTGGFHSGPFAEYFEKRGYNYALMTPKITTVDVAGRQSYLDVVQMWASMPKVSDTKVSDTNGSVGSSTLTQPLAIGMGVRAREFFIRVGAQFSPQNLWSRLMDALTREAAIWSDGVAAVVGSLQHVPVPVATVRRSEARAWSEITEELIAYVVKENASYEGLQKIAKPGNLFIGLLFQARFSDYPHREMASTLEMYGFKLDEIKKILLELDAPKIRLRRDDGSRFTGGRGQVIERSYNNVTFGSRGSSADDLPRIQLHGWPETHNPRYVPIEDRHTGLPRRVLPTRAAGTFARSELRAPGFSDFTYQSEAVAQLRQSIDALGKDEVVVEVPKNLDEEFKAALREGGAWNIFGYDSGEAGVSYYTLRSSRSEMRVTKLIYTNTSEVLRLDLETAGDENLKAKTKIDEALDAIRERKIISLGLQGDILDLILAPFESDERIVWSQLFDNYNDALRENTEFYVADSEKYFFKIKITSGFPEMLLPNNPETITFKSKQPGTGLMTHAETGTIGYVRRDNVDGGIRFEYSWSRGDKRAEVQIFTDTEGLVTDVRVTRDPILSEDAHPEIFAWLQSMKGGYFGNDKEFLAERARSETQTIGEEIIAEVQKQLSARKNAEPIEISRETSEMALRTKSISLSSIIYERYKIFIKEADEKTLRTLGDYIDFVGMKPSDFAEAVKRELIKKDQPIVTYSFDDSSEDASPFVWPNLLIFDRIEGDMLFYRLPGEMRVIQQTLSPGSTISISTRIPNDLKLDRSEAREIDAESFQRAVDEMIGKVKVGDVKFVVGTNVKEFVVDLQELYATYNRYLTEKYNGNARLNLSVEAPSEKKHDFPGFVSILNSLSESNIRLEDEKIVIVTDGGSKTRPANEILLYGYTGLWTLPGSRFQNLHEGVMVNTLAIMEAMGKEFSKRFLGWVASDNFIFLGAAKIGKTPLHKVAEAVLNKASVVKGAIRVDLLTPSDIEKLKLLEAKKGLEAAWTQAEVEAELGAADWERVLGVIDNDDQKLHELGTVVSNPDGLMIDFAEKESDFGQLVKLWYRYQKDGNIVYKNPFNEFLDKEFAMKLKERFGAEKSQSEDPNITDLSTIWVSYMQTVYQSRFLSVDQWMALRPKSTHKLADGRKIDSVNEADWKRAQEIVGKVFDEERDPSVGRGDILIIDYGDKNQWIDLGNLDVWYKFLSSIPGSKDLRRDLGIGEHEKAVNVKGNIEVEDGAYAEHVTNVGKGKLIVKAGALVSEVIVDVPQGETWTWEKGTVVKESDFRGFQSVSIPAGAFVERVFYAQGMPAKLIARKDERLASHLIKGESVLIRNIISVGFKGDKVKKIAPTPQDWAALVEKHTEYLGQYDYEAIRESDLFSLKDKNLAGLTPTEAQHNADYTWLNNKVNSLRAALEVDGAHSDIRKISTVADLQGLSAQGWGNPRDERGLIELQYIKPGTITFLNRVIGFNSGGNHTDIAWQAKVDRNVEEADNDSVNVRFYGEGRGLEVAIFTNGLNEGFAIGESGDAEIGVDAKKNFIIFLGNPRAVESLNARIPENLKPYIQAQLRSEARPAKPEFLNDAAFTEYLLSDANTNLSVEKKTALRQAYLETSTTDTEIASGLKILEASLTRKLTEILRDAEMIHQGYDWRIEAFRDLPNNGSNEPITSLGVIPVDVLNTINNARAQEPSFAPGDKVTIGDVTQYTREKWQSLGLVGKGLALFEAKLKLYGLSLSSDPLTEDLIAATIPEVMKQIKELGSKRGSEVVQYDLVGYSGKVSNNPSSSDIGRFSVDFSDPKGKTERRVSLALRSFLDKYAKGMVKAIEVVLRDDALTTTETPVIAIILKSRSEARLIHKEPILIKDKKFSGQSLLPKQILFPVIFDEAIPQMGIQAGADLNYVAVASLNRRGKKVTATISLQKYIAESLIPDAGIQLLGQIDFEVTASGAINGAVNDMPAKVDVSKRNSLNQEIVGEIAEYLRANRDVFNRSESRLVEKLLEPVVEVGVEVAAQDVKSKFILTVPATVKLETVLEKLPAQFVVAGVHQDQGKILMRVNYLPSDRAENVLGAVNLLGSITQAQGGRVIKIDLKSQPNQALNLFKQLVAISDPATQEQREAMIALYRRSPDEPIYVLVDKANKVNTIYKLSDPSNPYSWTDVVSFNDGILPSGIAPSSVVFRRAILVSNTVLEIAQAEPLAGRPEALVSIVFRSNPALSLPDGRQANRSEFRQPLPFEVKIVNVADGSKTLGDVIRQALKKGDVGESEVVSIELQSPQQRRINLAEADRVPLNQGDYVKGQIIRRSESRELVFKQRGLILNNAQLQAQMNYPINNLAAVLGEHFNQRSVFVDSAGVRINPIEYPAVNAVGYLLAAPQGGRVEAGYVHWAAFPEIVPAAPQGFSAIWAVVSKIWAMILKIFKLSPSPVANSQALDSKLFDEVVRQLTGKDAFDLSGGGKGIQDIRVDVLDYVDSEGKTKKMLLVYPAPATPRSEARTVINPIDLGVYTDLSEVNKPMPQLDALSHPVEGLEYRRMKLGDLSAATITAIVDALRKSALGDNQLRFLGNTRDLSNVQAIVRVDRRLDGVKGEDLLVALQGHPNNGYTATAQVTFAVPLVGDVSQYITKLGFSSHSTVGVVVHRVVPIKMDEGRVEIAAIDLPPPAPVELALTKPVYNNDDLVADLNGYFKDHDISYSSPSVFFKANYERPLLFEFGLQGGSAVKIVFDRAVDAKNYSWLNFFGTSLSTDQLAQGIVSVKIQDAEQAKASASQPRSEFRARDEISVNKKSVSQAISDFLQIQGVSLTTPKVLLEQYGSEGYLVIRLDDGRAKRVNLSLFVGGIGDNAPIDRINDAASVLMKEFTNGTIDTVILRSTKPDGRDFVRRPAARVLRDARPAGARSESRISEFVAEIILKYFSAGIIDRALANESGVFDAALLSAYRKAMGSDLVMPEDFKGQENQFNALAVLSGANVSLGESLSKALQGSESQRTVAESEVGVLTFAALFAEAKENPKAVLAKLNSLNIQDRLVIVLDENQTRKIAMDELRKLLSKRGGEQNINKLNVLLGAAKLIFLSSAAARDEVASLVRQRQGKVAVMRMGYSDDLLPKISVMTFNLTDRGRPRKSPGAAWLNVVLTKAAMRAAALTQGAEKNDASAQITKFMSDLGFKVQFKNGQFNFSALEELLTTIITQKYIEIMA